MPHTGGPWVRIALALVALMLAQVFTTGCGRTRPKRTYYTLTYPAPERRLEPHPITLRVKTLSIPQTYRRAEVVFRPDVHEIRYDKNRRWSEKPQQMVTELIANHMRASGVAAQVMTNAGERDPDYVLDGQIDALEVVEDGEDHHARLAVTLWLTRTADDTEVWRVSFDEYQQTADTQGTEVRSAVRAMSRILAVQLDKVSSQLHDFLDQSGPDSSASTQGAQGSSGQAPPSKATSPPKKASQGNPPQIAPQTNFDMSSGWFEPDPESPLNVYPQLLADETPLPPGRGAIFLPALSGGNREPPVAVYDGEGGKLVKNDRMGRKIVVAPGNYVVHFGSGPTDLQLTTKVKVKANAVTIVPPEWAAVEIRVVDPRFIPFRGTYEIIEARSRAEYGLGFGADELLAEQLRVWVLPKGLYKIIQAGGTYRDRTNFVTVNVNGGELTPYTLVIDEDDEEGNTFRGGGILVNPVLQGNSNVAQAADPWQIRALLGGDLQFDRSNEIGAQQGWSLALNVFLDSRARYLEGPHLSITRLEIEQGQLRPAGQDEFRTQTDRAFLNTVYTYRLVSWFGPYGRLGLETKLLARYQDYDEPTTITLVDEDGNETVLDTPRERVRLGGAFSPTEPLIGAGGNFIVLQTQALDLSLRTGFGARPTFAFGLRAVDNNDSSRIIDVEDSFPWGLEGTIVALGRVSRYVTIATEFDGLMALSPGDKSVFTWRNQLNVRLSSFLSLIYRLNLERNPNLGLGDQVTTDHDVQLRFSYNLF
ncbi:MAG: ABC-type transport auxiliary lipoprotein family protein [Bradymonadia bacterium]